MHMCVHSNGVRVRLHACLRIFTLAGTRMFMRVCVHACSDVHAHWHVYQTRLFLISYFLLTTSNCHVYMLTYGCLSLCMHTVRPSVSAWFCTAQRFFSLYMYMLMCALFACLHVRMFVPVCAYILNFSFRVKSGGTR